jgi:hypothetical protein
MDTPNPPDILADIRVDLEVLRQTYSSLAADVAGDIEQFIDNVDNIRKGWAQRLAERHERGRAGNAQWLAHLKQLSDMLPDFSKRFLAVIELIEAVDRAQRKVIAMATKATESADDSLPLGVMNTASEAAGYVVKNRHWDTGSRAFMAHLRDLSGQPVPVADSVLDEHAWNCADERELLEANLVLLKSWKVGAGPALTGQIDAAVARIGRRLVALEQIVLLVERTRPHTLEAKIAIRQKELAAKLSS